LSITLGGGTGFSVPVASVNDSYGFAVTVTSVSSG
jgi:hypothetical protein